MTYNNLKGNKRIKEGTPLGQRDEVAAFQAQRDQEEATPAAEKYKSELNSRNEKYYKAWQDFISQVNEAVDDCDGRGEMLGYDDFMANAYLNQTGYFDSWSFGTSPGIGFNAEAQGIAIYLYGSGENGRELGGDFIEEVVPAIKKCGGADLCVGGFWALDENSDKYDDIMNRGNYNFSTHKYDKEYNIKKIVNLHVKDMIESGHSRKDVAAEAQFLNSEINENTFKGCTDAYLDIGDNTEIFVTYHVSPIPTKEEIANVVAGVRKLASNMCATSDNVFA